MEIKEACFGGTAALLVARDYIAAHPGKQALIIAADIARYGLASGGEVTQGGGAVAILVSENPRIAEIEEHTSVYSGSIQDFWRPVYTDEAQARGKYSTEQYLEFFEHVWLDYAHTISYGSGAVAELFTARLVEGYEKALYYHADLLNQRTQVSVNEYESIFKDAVPYAPQDYSTNPRYYCGDFVLTGVVGMERQYATRSCAEQPIASAACD